MAQVHIELVHDLSSADSWSSALFTASWTTAVFWGCSCSGRVAPLSPHLTQPWVNATSPHHQPQLLGLATDQVTMSAPTPN